MALPTPPLPDWLVKLATNFLKQELTYLVQYAKNKKDLEDQVKKLKEELEKVRDRVAADEDRHGREIYDDVTKWLDGADTIISVCDEFVKQDDRAHAGCFSRFPPNLLATYLLSKKSIELKGKVEKQLEKAKFDIISHGGPPSVGLALSNVDYQSLASRDRAMEDILKALKDSSARMIGVHGPSGVGKTTLVLEAVNKVQNDQKKPKLFDVVIMANVTRSPNIKKIQGQIADMLWMKLEEESEEGRAGRIRDRLKKEKESTLIILDDLCGKVDLNILGIPWQSGDGNQKNPKGRNSPGSSAPDEKTKQQALDDDVMNDQKAPDASTSSPSPSVITLTAEECYKGCKVLLISEVRQVLNHVDVRSNLIVPVDLLDEMDARTLFNKMAGIGDKSPELGDLPTQIVKKCDGLPMSIVTTAKALKNQSHLVWQHTYQNLEKKMAGTSEHFTRLIYDRLEDVELQTIFLLCACMDNDALVSDLVRLCIGLGFLRGISTVKDARSRVHVMLMKLRESGLLSNSYSSDRFTMQNLVRNAALSIASKEKDMIMFNKEKLEEWPDDEYLKRYVAISLRHCDVTDAITKSMKCYKLQILEVNNDDPHLTLPNEFFKQMEELKVLILTGVHLSPLDSSMECLTKLRMLCIEHCTLIPSNKKSSSGKESSLSDELGVIEKLTNLRILSFSGSNIECLPVELGNLSKLQTLDISNCPKLSVIPPNVILRLTSLEELYMRKTPIQWPKFINGGENNESKKASLSELESLNQLTNLDIQIQSVDQLPEKLFFDKLSSYKIVIGSSNSLQRDFKMPEKHELSRLLAIHQKGGIEIHSQKAIKMLFDRVEYLLLGKLTGVQDLFYELNLKGFSCLKYLAIQNNHEIEFLINPQDRQQHQEKAFENLETLYLYKVTKIKEIYSPSCLLSKPSFENLKTIKINLCEELKYLFSTSMLKLLTSLETIQASDCDSLEKIVPVEESTDPSKKLETAKKEKSKELELLKLRTLTLQSLPEFIGFDIITPPTEGVNKIVKILFREKVEVSGLERIELRSIQVEQIWNDQSSGFGNLIHLDVCGCHNLKYLFPFWLATNLKKLQSLYVSECYQMENIFPPGKNAKDACFPNLKNIKVSKMTSLTKIWNLDVLVGSFGKLDTLVIEKCNKLENVFSHDMEGIFQGLSSLTVSNCKSMETIFDLTADDKKRSSALEIILRDVYLESLPKLKSILRCKEEQKYTLGLKSLQNVTVQHCYVLASIFPLSIVLDCQLGKLQCLVVSDCSELKAIVAAPNGTGDKSGSKVLEFPELTTIRFYKLLKFKSFYPGYCELKCEKLDDVSIELCNELELFREASATTGEENKSDAEGKPFFQKKVMNQLRSMHIELLHANLSTCYRRDKLEVLRLSRLEEKTEILYHFLHSNPNLKSLWLDNCSFGKLVEPKSSSGGIESKGVVPMLKTLKLTNLYLLKEIGFEHDPILQRIESLILENCPSLETIVPSKESICFTFLTNLEVVDCKSMKHVMPLSTAKSLGQLVTMKVTNCESLEEIILSESEKEPNSIVFKQMKALELVSLKNLKSFCSSESLTLHFPLLKKFVVSACPEMKNFSKKEIKTTPTIMQQVYVVRDADKKWYWEGGVQATLQHIYSNKKYFEGMDKISVSEDSELQECWKGKTENALDKGRFYSLKSLTLESCKLGSCAIPSFVLRCLKGLKELKVQNCRNITSIFELNDNIKGTFQLEKLTLDKLPEVTNVWSQQYKQNDGRFQNLKVVTFKSCRKLKALFPVAIASNLKMLEHLEVRSCYHLLEIVGGGEGQKSFVFPYLIRLRLFNLPQLTHFYDGKFTLECPELSDLHLFDCNKFELFQKPSSVIEGISKVITLRMGSKDTSVLSSWLQKSEKHQLEYLTGLTLTFDDDVKNECSTLNSEIFMRKTTRLKRMDIMNSTSHDKILFLSQNSKPPGNLTEVILQSLFQLSSIVGLEYVSNLKTLKIFQCPLLKTIEKYPPHLEKLYVQGCHGLRCLFTSSAARALKKLEELSVKDSKSLKEIVRKEQDDETAPQEKYLPQLKKLYVQGCHGLRCLFTSSAATALDKLEVLSVKDSRSLKQIVGKEQDDETAPQEIELKQLKNINIESLESLECFYPGNAALNLPSLAQVKICKCTKMTMLSQHLRDEDPSRKISVRDDKMDGQVTLSELNLAVGEQFLYQTHLLELEGEWVGSSRIPVKRSFGNVKTLVVDGCEFLTNAVLPSHLLRLLSNLENLTVKNCEHVEAIFDVKDIASEHDDPNKIVMIPLKIINLEELPTLTHVWNNDRKGSLSFPSLEEVSVAECKSIKSLFPASVPRVNLHQLHVRNCGELEEIVARDEAFLQDANNKAITLFPKLTYLMLSGLPKLSCICSGMQSLLDWLVVFKTLYVCGCPMLKLFPADIQNSPNSNPGDEDCFATHNDSHGKVISNLEKLMLSKEDVTMIDEKGFLHVDLQNTKYLGLDNFNDNEFPDAFFSKMSLPNLKEIELVDCAFKDICHSKGYDEGYSKILSQLKSVNLNNLHKLNSTGFEHHWMAPLLQNLETLKVSECNLLTNLAASSAPRKAVSFFSLKKLTVENCAGLKNLFTSSTAKSLVALQELSITKCKSLETIVAQETRDKPEDIVVFSKLQTLSLIELPLLESFYTGNSTLYFPAISNSAKILFTITKCNKMKTFSHGDVLPKFLQGKIDDDRCYGDLNSAVQEQFKRDFPIEKFNVAFIHDSPEC